MVAELGIFSSLLLNHNWIYLVVLDDSHHELPTVVYGKLSQTIH